MRPLLKSSLILCVAAAFCACGGGEPKAANTGETTGTESKSAAATKTEEKKPSEEKAAPAGTPKNLKTGLLVAISAFEKKDGKQVPGAARLEIITRQGGKWNSERIEDKDSNVFHKALWYEYRGKKGILTLGGTNAHVKLWTRKDGKWSAESVWHKDFGGKFNRMRDAEVANLTGKGDGTIAVATHDRGIVAIIEPTAEGWDVKEIDETKKPTFVHEIEIGDTNGDKKLEVYSTPSEPNNFDVEVQKGIVMRYDPVSGKGEVAADLGDRHAKEILVTDMDGDGTDELYVSVEAKIKKVDGKSKIEEPVEVRRISADGKEQQVVAVLDDRFSRFLTAGDIDGDGKKEMVAAPFKSGVWLLRPGANAKARWRKTLIDKKSGGFEHASILLDLDGDKKDELYVASDNHKEIRRYTWNGSSFDKEVIFKHNHEGGLFTWNIMPVPVSGLK